MLFCCRSDKMCCFVAVSIRCCVVLLQWRSDAVLFCCRGDQMLCCFVAVAIRCCVPPVATMFHTMQHDWCAAGLVFRTAAGCYQTEIWKKETKQQTGEVPAEEHAVTLLFTLHTVNDSPRLIKIGRDRLPPSFIVDNQVW